MKRKYLSALLMGVLTLSSVSTFTSCKDYDDDISNLQGQIDKLASAEQLAQKVSELQALISSNKSDITSLKDELGKKTTLDEVKAVLADYATKKYVDDADATLKAALDGDIDALKTAVAAAQTKADDAAAAAEKANADIKTMLETLATKAEVEEVQKAAKAANDAITALQNGDVATLKTKQAEILETLKTVATQNDLKLKDVADKVAEVEKALANKVDDKTLEAKVVELNNAIEAVKTTATEANKQAAANLVTINDLKKTVSEAKKACDLAKTNQTAITDVKKALGEGYSDKNTVAAAINAIKGQLTTPDVNLGTLDSRLALIEGLLYSVKDDGTKTNIKEQVDNIENKLKDIIGEYTTMVTEVSLIGSYHLNLNPKDPTESEPQDVLFGKADLTFMSDVVKKDLVFGKGQKDNTGKVVAEATDQQTYVKNTPFNNETSILVRVSPTNAELTKNTTIKLVDSKGRDLSGILELGTPKRFNTLLSRASAASGLWTIPVKVKAGVTSGQIEQKVGGYGADKENHILYAVAIKNTETAKDAQDRYVTSTYDLTVQKPTTFVATNEIKNVKVWSESTMGYANAITLTDNKKTSTPDAPGTTPKRVVSAKNNEKIHIDFSAYKNQIQYFYVVRDDNNVDSESGTSSINAWNSYKYTGLGKVLKADGDGIITIDLNKGHVGDEIGFRIFAVNYNGELAPDDGDSFVVYVGDQQNQASVAGELIPVEENNNVTGWLPLNGELKDGKKALSTTGSAKVNGKDINFTVEYSTDGQTAVTDWTNTKMSNVKYVRFTCITAMKDWKDDAKASFVLSTKNPTTHMVENEISVALTKKLPDAAYTKNTYKYTWKDEQLVNGKYTAYVYPTTGWDHETSDNTKGCQDLTQAITGLTPKFNITIDKIVADADGNYTKSKTVTPEVTGSGVTAITSCKVFVAKSLINGTTPHETTISYNYGAISTDHKNAEGNYVVKLETVQMVFACPLTADVQKYTWKQWSQTVGENTTIKDVNVLTYGNPATVENVNLLDYIQGTNSYDNTIFGGTLKDLLYGRSADPTQNITEFDQKYYTIEDLKLVSAVSGKPDYFKAEIEGSVLKFKSQSGTSNPNKDVKSYLKFTLVDAFGHKTPVSLDFTVKRAQ